MPPPFLFAQPVLSGPGPKLNLPIKFSSVRLSALKEEDLSPIENSRIIGIAPGYSKKGKLIGLAICNDSKGLIIQLDRRQQSKSRTKETQRQSDDSDAPSDSSDSGESATAPAAQDARQLLEDTILCRESFDFAIASFDCAPMAMALHCDANLRVTNAIDVQAFFPSKDPYTARRPDSAVRTALQGTHLDRIKASTERIESEFINTEFDPDKLEDRKELACRAWLACFLVSECADARAIEEFRRIDTKNLNPTVSAPGHFSFHSRAHGDFRMFIY